jgi:hypothetical protein
MLGTAGAGRELFRSLPTGGPLIYCAVDAVDALFERAHAAGADIPLELTDTEYGSRDFTVRDPEGNLWRSTPTAPRLRRLQHTDRTAQQLRTSKALYSADDDGPGTGSPCSLRLSMCIGMASRMSLRISSTESPAATQPGRSGEYAEKEPSEFSMTIKYFPASLIRSV